MEYSGTLEENTHLTPHLVNNKNKVIFKQNKSVFHHLVLYLFQLLESIYRA